MGRAAARAGWLGAAAAAEAENGTRGVSDAKGVCACGPETGGGPGGGRVTLLRLRSPRRASVVGRRGWQVQPLQRGEPLIDLPELDFNGA